MRSIFLAIPTLSGHCASGTEAAIGFFEMEASSFGWKFEQFRWTQDSLIAHARNVCVAKFMASDATDMVCLDSDVACGPGVLTRLMMRDEEMVAALYRVKNPVERYATVPPDGGFKRQANGLMEAKDIPFGMVRIKRSVIEKLHAAYPDDWFYANTEDRIKCHALFNTEIRDRLFWGEDYYFCRKWREIGGKVYIDPDIRLAHINGSGEAFAGSFSDFLDKHAEIEKNNVVTLAAEAA